MFAAFDEKRHGVLRYPEMQKIAAPRSLLCLTDFSTLQPQLHFFQRLIPEVNAGIVEGGNHLGKIANEIQRRTELHLRSSNSRQTQDGLHAAPACAQRLRREFALHRHGELRDIEFGLGLHATSSWKFT